jgi:hypothetical protein
MERERSVSRAVELPLILYRELTGMLRLAALHRLHTSSDVAPFGRLRRMEAAGFVETRGVMSTGWWESSN